MIISEDIKVILHDYGTKKVIATVNEEGVVHVAFKDMIFVDSNDTQAKEKSQCADSKILLQL